MKKYHKYIVLAALTLSFAACQQEDDFAPQGGGEQEIRLATRATTFDGNDDGFTEGQIMTIGIEPGVAPSAVSFYKYTYQNGEWVSNNPMNPAHVSNFAELDKIYMYIGYSGVNGWEKSVCLDYSDYLTDVDNRISDQSKGLLHFDWMIPAGEVTLPTVDNPVIYAQFIHGLVKVTVGKITYGSEYDKTPEITDVRFKGFGSSSYIENVFVGHSSNDGIADVVPFEDTTNGTYTALLVTNRGMGDNNEFVIPTEWTLLTLKVNGEEKTVKLVDDPETDKNEALLEPGKHYTFSLKVGKDKVTLIPTTNDTDFPGGWNTEENLN